MRERLDTPPLLDARDLVAALLSASPRLSPDNMAAAAALLVGPCPEAGGTGLAELPKGRVALLRGAQYWATGASTHAL